METNYETLGRTYNLTRKADTYISERILYLLKPVRDRHYLDIGCGTGNYTIALAAHDLDFVGVDPSEQMLDVARSRNSDITWVRGTAEQTPVEDRTFAGAIATLTVHHWTNIKKAFTEISRVLTNDGRLVLLTSTPEQMKGYWLNHYFPSMLQASISQMPALDTLQTAAEHAGFEISGIEKYFIKDDLQDSFLYVGKNRPELYFNETLRSGISSFSSLANQEEVKQGLLNLRYNLDHSLFDEIKEKYDNDLGDYLFLTFIKSAR